MKKHFILRVVSLRPALLGAVACCSLMTGTALASLTFSGDSTGTFVNPSPASGVTVTGVGTSLFTWGDATGTGTGPNSLRYNNTAFNNVAAETSFKLGTLTYYNGVTLIGTTPNNISLSLDVNFTSPGGVSQGFTYTMQLISTPNIGTGTQNADYVILSTFPSTTFTVGGSDYTLSLDFGNLKGGGFTQTGNELHVLEGCTATADLEGTITKDTSKVTTSVPEPSTGVAGALLLLPFGAGLLRFLRRNHRAA